MLISSELSQVPSVECLVEIWTARYLPELATLPVGSDPMVRSSLREASSEEGRARTTSKLHTQLVERQCQLAAVRARNLYDPQENSSLTEAVRLSKLTSQIYFQLLEVYQGISPIVLSSKGNVWETFGDTSLAAWGIPKINKLAETLEPLLLKLQEHHMIAKSWNSLGFTTTQIHLSNLLLLEQLTPVEQVLISPYFKFLEEQVALPWQRICAAAAKHSLTSPVFNTVEQMLPMATEISRSVHDRWYRSFPEYHSRRGDLNHPGVKHSSLRDFDMFQAYLWLCFLEGSLKFIEQELVAICIVVFESLNIPWMMTVKGNKFLIQEILSRLQPHQKKLIEPYAIGMLKAFTNR